MSPVQASLAFVVLTVGELTDVTIAMKTTGRFGHRLPLTGAGDRPGRDGLLRPPGQQQPSRSDPAMTAPLLLLGLAFGIIGGPLADLSLSKVPHENAGSASGLFNTSIYLGMALGTALTALVFFSTTGGSLNATLNRDASTSVLWWVSGAVALSSATILALTVEQLWRCGGYGVEVGAGGCPRMVDGAVGVA